MLKLTVSDDERTGNMIQRRTDADHHNDDKDDDDDYYDNNILKHPHGFYFLSSVAVLFTS